LLLFVARQWMRAPAQRKEARAPSCRRTACARQNAGVHALEPEAMAVDVMMSTSATAMWKTMASTRRLNMPGASSRRASWRANGPGTNQRLHGLGAGTASLSGSCSDQYDTITTIDAAIDTREAPSWRLESDSGEGLSVDAIRPDRGRAAWRERCTGVSNTDA
jgi:hypothetical protein